MLPQIKRLFESILESRGYRLRYADQPVRGFDNFIQFLQQRGFQPKTVIDVGAGSGTPWLYSIGNAHYVLFEPVRLFASTLESLRQSLPSAEVHHCALGASNGMLPITIPVKVPTGSSLLPRTKAFQQRIGAEETVQDVVPVKRLDDFAAWPGPYLLKIDVEGAELQVLQGAAEKLKLCEVIICEIGVLRRMEGDADIITLSSFLREHGFELFDIPDMACRQGQLSYLDAAFVRVSSPLWNE